MNIEIENNWDKFFSTLLSKEYFKSLLNFLDEEYKNKTIYPPKEDIFNAFKLCPPENIKVVIIGQDPYINKNEAMGLAFSTKNTAKLPPSLKNIYKEWEIEFNKKAPLDGDLTYLARQGVFLLNTILTVEAQKPLSHDIDEYKKLIEDILNFIENLNQPIVFMLWGGKAKKFEKLIKNSNHLILKSNHPSPLSANRGGWFNTNIFLDCNKYLVSKNIEPVKRIKE